MALARRDPVSSLRPPGRVAIALRMLFGARRSYGLANPKLEALRRIAVLSWRLGPEVGSAEVSDFIAAGFTARQYELLAASIEGACAEAPPGDGDGEARRPAGRRA